MTGRTPATATTLTAVCACLMTRTLLGCAAQSPTPTPRGDATAIVVEVVAKPKEGAKAHRFARVPVYDAAPQPAPPSGQFELVDYSALDDVIVWLEPAGATPDAETTDTADADSEANDDGEGDAADDDEAGEGNTAAVPVGPPPPPLTVTIAARVHPDDVRAASVGQELVFRNDGPEVVSLYSVSDDNDFDLPEIPPGGEARYTVRAAGMIEVLADPSDPPVAVVYAVGSPWVARTRSGGRVVFRDVSPGAYEAVSWHPRLPGSTAPVSLPPGGVTRVALNVGVNVLAADQP